MRLVVCLLAAAGVFAQTPGDRAYDALRARDSDPARVNIRKDLAYVYLKVGENELARAQFREAMRLDPDDDQVALEYAFLAYESKAQAEARRIFDRIRKKGNAVAEQAFRNID